MASPRAHARGRLASRPASFDDLVGRCHRKTSLVFHLDSAAMGGGTALAYGESGSLMERTR